jgi:NAD-dependent deacetylase
VAALPQLTLARGGRLALVTQGPTPYDGDAALKLTGDVVDELEGVVTALGRADELRPPARPTA